MQMWALGMATDVADTETGESIAATGQSGELVGRKPFPSMPSGFWGDEGNKKYHESYFERFDESVDVWAQHDFAQYNPKTGGIQIHGRSDGVLNPSGVRFGSAEIYSIVEGPAFNGILSDTVCVGRRRRQDKDEAVFLFVIMNKGHHYNAELESKIRDAIRSGLSPRHVPKFIFEVDEIPYTMNGKKVEIAIKKIISGLDVKVSSTVSNPGSLKKFERFRNVDQARRTKL